MNLPNDLTPKQKRIFEYIKNFRNSNAYSPTFEEIASYFGITISTVQQYIDTLNRKGYLRKKKNIPRGIIPTEEKSQIMLLGRIAAGKPIEPIEDPEQVSVPSTMINKPGCYYGLIVKGDSMIEEGILDGDTIVVKHQDYADNGEIVVAVTENGATLKIFRNENNRIFLEPRNQKLSRIFPKSLEIRGKFIGLIRN